MSEDHFAPNQTPLLDVAANYARDQGRTFDLEMYSQSVACPILMREIALAYDAAPDLADDEEIRTAYAALREETWRQYDLLAIAPRRGGLGIDITTTNFDPYPDADALVQDLDDNRLRVYRTDACGNLHPLLDNDDNDAFRAVHDGFGHGIGKYAFTPDGEEQAWWLQRDMYSAAARMALMTEARAQISFYAAGMGEGFPRQKATLLDPQLGSLATRHVVPCEPAAI